MVEAMAMTDPVVATAKGGPAEVIDTGINGVLASPQDPREWARAITALLDDRERAETLGANARRTVLDRFDRTTVVAETIAAYRAALSGSRATVTETHPGGSEAVARRWSRWA
jgi:glycosyltransferase involved in cell wall biosynthesis